MEAPVKSPAAKLFNLPSDHRLCEHYESDEEFGTHVSSRCSSASEILRKGEDSAAEIITETTSMRSSSNLSNFSVIDSTLREGEQFATAYFNTAQKLRIAQALDDFGVEYVSLSAESTGVKSRDKRIARLILYIRSS